MYTIYKDMYDIIEELKDEDISIEKIRFLFDEPYILKNTSLLKKAVRDLADERIKSFIEKVMKKQFDSFIDDTMGIWNDMVVGEIRKLDKTTIQGTAAGMFEHPFNIVYFFKQQGPEGPEYTFLDDDANKIYSDYRPF